MRIKKIEIQNFRAFYGNFEIELGGKNLLLYGENGSGKSSLFYALKLFLESANAKTEFSEHRNIFVEKNEEGFIKLTLDNGVNYEWSEADTFPTASIILEADKIKGFLDYKNLLETHFLHSQRNENSVNLFHLLVENLLTNYQDPSSGKQIGEVWQSIKSKPKPRKSNKNYDDKLNERNAEISFMNDILRLALLDLQKEANKLLDFFNYNTDFQFESFSIENQNISIGIKFFGESIKNHHAFLNEARLSAIALSIYFASILKQPNSDLRILALDDVLVGLDMANRLPVIDILEQHFSEHQVFFITHDKLWFEMMRMRVQRNEKWKNAELYSSQNNGLELPVYVENKKYLERAKEHLEANDYKAAAVYARSAFEEVLKNFCKKKDIKIKYRDNIKELKSDDFWQEIKSIEVEIRQGKKPKLKHQYPDKFDVLFTDLTIVDEIELYRNVVLNPLSHSQIINITKDEVSKAIDAVAKLEKELC
jgi:energy-coupling factor transporter ATP-binding protein EcfA2